MTSSVITGWMGAAALAAEVTAATLRSASYDFDPWSGDDCPIFTRAGILPLALASAIGELTERLKVHDWKSCVRL